MRLRRCKESALQNSRKKSRSIITDRYQDIELFVPLVQIGQTRNRRVNDSLGIGMVRILNFGNFAQGSFRELNFAGPTTCNERGTVKGVAI